MDDIISLEAPQAIHQLLHDQPRSFFRKFTSLSLNDIVEFTTVGSLHDLVIVVISLGETLKVDPVRFILHSVHSLYLINIHLNFFLAKRFPLISWFMHSLKLFYLLKSKYLFCSFFPAVVDAAKHATCYLLLLVV